MVVLASEGGNDVAAITRLVQTSPDRVREMIHRFDNLGMRSLDPQWAGGRPPQITTTDRALIIKTVGGSVWSPKGRPERLRASHHKPHGSRQFYAWYAIGADRLDGNLEPVKGAVPTLRALQAIRASVDDCEPIHVILDNSNHHRGHAIRDWCADNNVELAFTPTYASWANPIEAHFGPLRQFVIADSDYRDHPALATAIRKYARWRNAHTRDPDVLDDQRRHAARIRSEQQRRWGHPRTTAA